MHVIVSFRSDLDMSLCTIQMILHAYQCSSDINAVTIEYSSNANANRIAIEMIRVFLRRIPAQVRCIVLIVRFGP
jgi:hypothetical protein